MLLSILFIAVLLFSIQWYSLNRSLRFLTYSSRIGKWSLSVFVTR